ncbi:MAG TPA: response regulator [Myxococcaceae bacterium]|nr:response regulator [Myxococcaceae bacterium]
MTRPRILVVDDNVELLSLLTHLFEDAGYEVVAASKGKQALELIRAQPPALALLDILLPDVMGYAVAEALRRENPQVPVVFVTGVFKGSKHALEGKSRHAAAAYFEKPFESKKLLEAVTQLVPPGAPQAAPEEFEVELDIDIEEEDPEDTMELSGRVQVSGATGPVELKGDVLRASPIRRGSDPGARRPAEPSRATPPGLKLRRGELRDNLPSLISAFFLSGETGELGVQKGAAKKVVFFEEGQPVFALSNLLADRFGQFLVRTGRIRADQLADAAQVAQRTGKRTGDVLVERGLLADADRVYYLGQQVKAIIYSLFAWEEGSYVMSFGGRARQEYVRLDVHPATLIARGMKKLYKPERVRRLLALEDRLAPSRQLIYPLADAGLDRWEAELLPLADGTRTVAELVAHTKRPEASVQLSLAVMLALQLLEKR